MTPRSSSTTIWRSLGAIFAGIIVGIILTIGTDALLQKAGAVPPQGKPATSGPLLFATLYRTIYGIIASYITARLAPYKPMAHVLMAGAMGAAANALGAVATWDKNLGPQWYPIALTVLALPTAWAGGKLWLTKHPGAR